MLCIVTLELRIFVSIHFTHIFKGKIRQRNRNEQVNKQVASREEEEKDDHLGY